MRIGIERDDAADAVPLHRNRRLGVLNRIALESPSGRLRAFELAGASFAAPERAAPPGAPPPPRVTRAKPEMFEDVS